MEETLVLTHLDYWGNASTAYMKYISHLSLKHILLMLHIGNIGNIRKVKNYKPDKLTMEDTNSV